jgi:hypothetical protein
MYDRVYFVIRSLKKLFGVKSLEKFFLPREEGVEGGNRQRFAESARSGEKVGSSSVDKIDKVARLIDVKVTFIPDRLKGLDANGQFQQAFSMIGSHSIVSSSSFVKCSTANLSRG